MIESFSQQISIGKNKNFNTNPLIAYIFEKEIIHIYSLDHNIINFHNSTTTEEMNLNSVKYVYIYDIQSTINSRKYFPNVNQLTILSNDKISDDLISSTLNHLIPLDQLAELNLVSSHLILDDLLKLLRFTSNLNSLFLNACTLKLPQNRENLKYIASINKIKKRFMFLMDVH